MNTSKKNIISIVWDFDETLSVNDSTTEVVKSLQGTKDGGDFWKLIKSLRGDKKQPEWHHVLASDAPIWMYSLSRLAFQKKVPLNSEFFRKFVLPQVKLHDNVIPFLKKINKLSKKKRFIKANLEIHHFIVSAGLKNLVEQVFPKNLITWTFGCRYTIVYSDTVHKNEPESVPVFCMDETMKTRSIFEIVKGSFGDPNKGVNIRVEKEKLWSPFENIIYIGDGFSDIPALSLVRDRGGIGIAVYDADWTKEKVDTKHKDLRLDKRTDFITAAKYSLSGSLYEYIEARCLQICQRYEAEQSV